MWKGGEIWAGSVAEREAMCVWGGTDRIRVNEDTSKIAVNAAKMEIHTVYLVLAGTSET